MTRNPSCLISCSHSLFEGSLSVLVARHGAMKPDGRVRCNIAPIAKAYSAASQPQKCDAHHILTGCDVRPFVRTRRSASCGQLCFEGAQKPCKSWPVTTSRTVRG